MQQKGEHDEHPKRMVVDVAVTAGPLPNPIPHLHLAKMKSSPLLQSQDILAALQHAVDSAGDDMLVTERGGIPSARAGGLGMPPSPLSRYLAETAFSEKKDMIRALDRAATERATTPAAQLSRLAGRASGWAGKAVVTQPQAGSSRRGFKGLFACFGR